MTTKVSHSHHPPRTMLLGSYSLPYMIRRHYHGAVCHAIWTGLIMVLIISSSHCWQWLKDNDGWLYCSSQPRTHLAEAVKQLPPMGTNPFQKRGPEARAQYETTPLVPLSKGGTTRLLVHAVGDATATQWVPKVKDFLHECVKSGVSLQTAVDVDVALAEKFDRMCYGDRVHVSSGMAIFFGILCLMPELKQQLHLASRSLKSWQKLTTTAEGSPMCEEALLAVAIWLVEGGETLAGCWVLCQYDVYGREQDMEMLNGSDISFDNKVMSLTFGESSRGESVKTGFNQGAIVRRGVVVDIFLALRQRSPSARVFDISQQRMRMLWRKACLALGMSFCGPMHTIRHAAASEDVARSRSSLENVRRRGRWKHMSSVQRYTKTHALAKFRARMPQTVRAKGEAIGKDIRKALIAALLRSPEAKSPLSKALLAHLRAARGQDCEADIEVDLRTEHKKGGKKASSGRSNASTDTDYSSDVSEEGWWTE